MESQQVYFFTATILGWNPLLKGDRYKQIILDSMAYLVAQNRCAIFGFVLMPNHIHLLWQMNGTHKMEDVQRDFLKFTGQMIKTDLEKSNSALLQKFYVNLKDRKYQIWKRNSLSIKMFSKEVMEQKLDYIHNNPVQGKWMLVNNLLDYKYSSVRFYELEECEEFPFLLHYMEYYE
ncbi:MAG: transposase [Cyclobacteriaceae bacterium]|nr:transposase [Cyclobacteriaceae bacterium]